MSATPPLSVWVQGARPRTLTAAVAPVLIGTAAGTLDGPLRWWRALGALVVALALQVGVNYANDYSDGVRGTDERRVGPVRLVAGGLASPAAVKRAAMAAFGVAAAVGLWLSLVVNPWLLLLGLVSIVLAVGYTGGPRPYGYLGFGELAVLVCFGLFATAGSAYVQHEHVNATAWWGCLVAGLPAVAILLANNIRDVPTDTEAGKRTLAVRVGVARARLLFVASIVLTMVAIAAIAVLEPPAAIALVSVVFALGPVRMVMVHHDPRSLIRVLGLTARFQIVSAVLLAVGLVWAG